MMDINQFKSYAFVGPNHCAPYDLKNMYGVLLEHLYNEKFTKEELKDAVEQLSDKFVNIVKVILEYSAAHFIREKNDERGIFIDAMVNYCKENEVELSDKFINLIKNDFVVKDESSTEKPKMESTVENIVDTIADIIDPDVRRGYEDSPEGALATYANNMAFIPPYHSMQQQVLPPQQTIPQSQQINPSIQQQMVLLNKPDIVDANYALKYDLRDITEIDNLTIRINKVFANPEILEFINKFKFINKFYVAEYKKSEFTLMAPTSTSYVYIKALSDGDYKVAEIPFKPN